MLLKLWELCMLSWVSSSLATLLAACVLALELASQLPPSQLDIGCLKINRLLWEPSCQKLHGPGGGHPNSGLIAMWLAIYVVLYSMCVSSFAFGPFHVLCTSPGRLCKLHAGGVRTYHSRHNLVLHRVASDSTIIYETMLYTHARGKS